MVSLCVGTVRCGRAIRSEERSFKDLRDVQILHDYPGGYVMVRSGLSRIAVVGIPTYSSIALFSASVLPGSVPFR
jgi:hypothetical protein